MLHSYIIDTQVLQWMVTTNVEIEEIKKQLQTIYGYSNTTNNYNSTSGNMNINSSSNSNNNTAAALANNTLSSTTAMISTNITSLTERYHYNDESGSSKNINQAETVRLRLHRYEESLKNGKNIITVLQLFNNYGLISLTNGAYQWGNIWYMLQCCPIWGYLPINKMRLKSELTDNPGFSSRDYYYICNNQQKAWYLSFSEGSERVRRKLEQDYNSSQFGLYNNSVNNTTRSHHGSSVATSSDSSGSSSSRDSNKVVNNIISDVGDVRKDNITVHDSSSSSMLAQDNQSLDFNTPGDRSHISSSSSSSNLEEFLKKISKEGIIKKVDQINQPYDNNYDDVEHIEDGDNDDVNFVNDGIRDSNNISIVESIGDIARVTRNRDNDNNNITDDNDHWDKDDDINDNDDENDNDKEEVEDEGTDSVSPIDDVEEYFYRNELMMIKSNNDLPIESSSSSSLQQQQKGDDGDRITTTISSPVLNHNTSSSNNYNNVNSHDTTNNDNSDIESSSSSSCSMHRSGLLIEVIKGLIGSSEWNDGTATIYNIRRIYGLEAHIALLVLTSNNIHILCGFFMIHRSSSNSNNGDSSGNVNVGHHHNMNNHRNNNNNHASSSQQQQQLNNNNYNNDSNNSSSSSSKNNKSSSSSSSSSSNVNSNSYIIDWISPKQQQEQFLNGNLRFSSSNYYSSASNNDYNDNDFIDDIYKELLRSDLGYSRFSLSDIYSFYRHRYELKYTAMEITDVNGYSALYACSTVEVIMMMMMIMSKVIMMMMFMMNDDYIRGCYDFCM